MANRNISATVQIGATMSSSVGSVFGGITRKVNDLGASLSKLKRQSADIGRLQAAQGRLADAKASGNATAIARYSAQVEKLSSSLREAGVDTSKLTQEQARLAAQIGRTEAQLGRWSRLGANFTGLKSAAANVGSAFGKVKDNVTGLATKIGVLGTAAGYLFKTQFVDTAAEFERLQTILKTLEGGNVSKAKQAFGWINDFAAKTPYDLKTVTEAFVRLRAYGIDPIKGDTLRTLGDTASAMGKSVMDAVEAIADAVTGENERLKEFGIKAAKEGGKIIYSYTDKAGKQRQKAVDASNREMIRSTLTAIWNEKYAGAMEEQSRTWQGMMSNLGDQWTRFTARVMASGVFDWMKGKLGAVLDNLNRAAEDGRLQAWAEQTGKAIKDAFVALFELGKAAHGALTSVVKFVGGWKNLGIAIAAVALAPTALSVVQLTTSLYSLGAAVVAMTGPWGLLAVAIGAAAAAIYKNWDAVAGWFRTNVYLPIAEAINDLKALWQGFTDWIGRSAVGQWFGGLSGPTQEMLKGIDSNVARSRMGELPQIAPRTPRPTSRRADEPLLPPANMPAAGKGTTMNNNVKQDFQINVTVPPGTDGNGIGEAVKSKLKERDLYDMAAFGVIPQTSAP